MNLHIVSILKRSKRDTSNLIDNKGIAFSANNKKITIVGAAPKC